MIQEVDPVAGGPEIRPVYRSGAPGAHVQEPDASPAIPHGHGFIAATSWNRAGKRTARPTRAIET